jgi:hypothetical protein
MLKFDAAKPSFVSTRCLDGEPVSGVALRRAPLAANTKEGHERDDLPPGWWD